jgi:3-oxoacyl-[acyl-carrier protein] reductase
MRFKNKVVIVTGSSRGIGKATAALFAKEGAKLVVVADINDKEGEEAVDEIKKAKGDAFYAKCDVSKEEQVKRMMEETVKKFGRIDILGNNAGIVFDVPFEKRTVEQWKRTLEVNLIGTFLCCKYAAPHMKKQNSGKIVNVSSTNGIDSFASSSMDYDSSKAGIIILTRNLAKELAPAIQVNSVAPGWVDTDFNKGLSKEFIEEETEKIYMKRFAKPEEIAKAILFLASSDADYITGITLKIDGGYG